MVYLVDKKNWYDRTGRKFIVNKLGKFKLRPVLEIAEKYELKKKFHLVDAGLSFLSRG